MAARPLDKDIGIVTMKILHSLLGSSENETKQPNNKV